jgi:ceramide synthetase
LQRKDFKEMIIHHSATLLLLFFSYFVNYWRVGTLVMVVHDVADIALEAGKSLNYSGTCWRSLTFSQG